MRLLHDGDGVLHWHRPLAWAVAATLSLCLLTACSDSTASPTAAGSSTSQPPTVTGLAAVTAIELTDEGFSPDRTEVKQGARLTLRNATDSKQSVVVKGRDFGGANGKSVTLEAGQTIDLDVRQLGAYVLTLADDPQVTASIFIS